MDTQKSILKGYGKVDEMQDLAFKKKMSTRFIIIAVSVGFLVAILIGSIVAVIVHIHKNKSPGSNPELTPSVSLKTVCSVTDYPVSCVSSISKIMSSNTTTDPVTLFKLSLKVVVDELGSISSLPKKLANVTNNERTKSALGVCEELIDDAIYSLNETFSVMEVEDKKNTLTSRNIDDLKTWLSAALTDHETCFDALDELRTDSTISGKLKSAMRNSTEFTSNSLAIVARVLDTLKDLDVPIHGRRLLSSESPSWVSPTARRLLKTEKLTPSVTVAADGSGDVKTVNEAVAKVPTNGTTLFVIYVKAGTYVENVFMDKSKWNVMIYGDGMANTIISGSRSNVTGFPTFWTATFITVGKNFIMKDIGIINTAGPTMHQAVAFRSGSDHSVYYRCSFDGYQDTLYTHSRRQFYRDCDITGTVDFIFGDAAVVFQNCNIRPRQPLPGQYNTITAQGRTNQSQNTGISIQRCTITPNGIVTALTYLGRPWKGYSTTVIMESWIGPLVTAQGWMPWNLSSAIYLGEYKNTGPGSVLTERIKWDVLKPVMSDDAAGRFTVATFLNGNDWLPATGVQYQPT